MNEMREKHNRAVDLKEEVDVARLREKGKMLEALELETEAANATSVDMQPTHAVMFRSAASIAVQCGEYGKARRLIDKGLEGEPPGEIADELRELRGDCEKA